jgi:hypothetical protein
VERRPFLAPGAVIFGVDFTRPYILDVIMAMKIVQYSIVCGSADPLFTSVDPPGVRL